ncbi:MAG: hypothetical protein N3G21_04975 [Candidatus Hydrogenedentes bacterium]|nr:hypothetical protein [Candidatus Hydrogenedentota bacterium]
MREKLNLNGEWILLVDNGEDGVINRWYIDPPLGSGEKIHVPLTQPLSLFTKATKFWFIKQFDLQNSWADPLTNISLNLEYINFQADIWVNGHRLEPHFGAFTKFKRNLPSHILKEKDNLIVISVCPLFNTSESNLPLHFFANELSQLTGIWGNVYLQKTPQICIESIYIKSDLKNKRVIVNIYPNNKNVKLFRVKIPELEIEVESKKPKVTIPLQDFEKWTLEDPRLYSLLVQLDTENFTDEVIARLGIRDLSIIDGKFYFNFKQVILKSVYFDWSLNHLSMKDFSPENLKKHLIQIKEAGFNSLLSIDKPLPERILQICDEIGILVGESPSFTHSYDKETTNLHFEKELKEILYYHRNHPSFVWLMINTSTPENNIPKLVREVRKFDRARVLTINKNLPDSSSLSFSCTPFTVELLPTKITTLNVWLPANDETLLWLESLNTPKGLQFIINREFLRPTNTQISLQDMRDIVLSELEKGFAGRDLALSFQSAEKMLENTKLVSVANFNSIIQSIRKNENISGYCLFKSSLNGTEIFNNLMFLFSDNTVKQTLKRYNQNLKIIIELGKTNLIPSESTSINVTIKYPENSLCSAQGEMNTLAEVLLQITSPTQQTLWRKKKIIKIKKDIHELYSADISASTATGIHILTGRLLINKLAVSETYKSFYVAPPPKSTECLIEIIDPTKNFTKQCLPWIQKTSPLAPIIILPPLANTIFGYPDNEFSMMINSIREGAIGVVFSPPHDWNLINHCITDCPKIHIQSIENYPKSFIFHYVKPHPVFINLPTRQLMRLPYRNIIGKEFFLNKSDEDATGCMVISNSVPPTVTWGTTLLILRYGVGRIVFTTLKILENLEDDPVAQHIFVNLLNHLSRRATPPEKPPLPITNAVEFMRYKKNSSFRKWMVIGPLPKDPDFQVPNSHCVDKFMKSEMKFETMFGKSSAKIWFTSENDGHKLNLLDALGIQTYTHHLEEFSFSSFAYAEFVVPQKTEAIFQIETPNIIQVWVNENLIIENLTMSTDVKIYEAKTQLKPSKNSILVKCAKERGPLYFILNIYDKERKKLDITWSN